MSANVLVTGASGFVGNALCRRILSDRIHHCRIATRKPCPTLHGVEEHLIPGLATDTDWDAALRGVTVVIHCAARVHVMQEDNADPLAEFRRVNVQGTLALARQAAAAGVQRFVFISSIKVNGESTSPGQPFRADDPPSPADHYCQSKLEAEQGLQALSQETGMQLVIIRPVVVYGPGAKANIHSLMRWLKRGIPLPLGAIHNSRSLVALDNLVDLLVTCIDHPAAAGRVWLVSDGEDLSTTALLQRMATAMGVPARLLPIPAGWVQALARLTGRGDMAQRLCGSLQVDSTPTRELLGWQPPITVDAALAQTADHFLGRRRA